MGLTIVNGLPAHVLLVHLVVVLVPVAAVMVVLSAAWPAARRRLGIATPLVALASTVVVPVTTDAGEWLERRVPDDPLVAAHAELGDELLPWTIGLLVIAVVVWALHRFGPVGAVKSTVDEPAGRTEQAASSETATATETATRARAGWVTAVTVALLVGGLAAAGGSVYQVYRIGDSGAKAAWHDKFSPNPLPGSERRGDDG